MRRQSRNRAALHQSRRIGSGWKSARAEEPDWLSFSSTPVTKQIKNSHGGTASVAAWRSVILTTVQPWIVGRYAGRFCHEHPEHPFLIIFRVPHPFRANVEEFLSREFAFAFSLERLC